MVFKQIGKGKKMGCVGNCSWEDPVPDIIKPICYHNVDSEVLQFSLQTSCLITTFLDLNPDPYPSNHPIFHYQHRLMQVANVALPLHKGFLRSYLQKPDTNTGCLGGGVISNKETM